MTSSSVFITGVLGAMMIEMTSEGDTVFVARREFHRKPERTNRIEARANARPSMVPAQPRRSAVDEIGVI
jgi:hypothetical protein